MWDFDSLGIPYNAADGTIALPLWAAGVAAGLILVLFVLALIRTGLAGTLIFLALVAFGGWAVWAWLDNERSTERRALEARATAIAALAAAPNSPLACLDGAAGETIQAACERDLFASPETAAAAVSHTASRIALLADGMSFANRRDPAFAGALDALRAGLERDRYGIVAHVLVVRNGCTAEKCDALNAFRESNRIRNNIRERTFDAHLARAAPIWNARPATRASSEAPAAPAGAPQPPMRASALPPDYNLPSASSIPPVSIMTPEPAGAPDAAAAPAQQQEQQQQQQAPPTPPRRPAQQQRPAQPQQQQQRPAQRQSQQQRQQQQQRRERPAPRREQTETATPPGQLPPPPTRTQ